jgi:hypothetical protein
LPLGAGPDLSSDGCLDVVVVVDAVGISRSAALVNLGYPFANVLGGLSHQRPWSSASAFTFTTTTTTGFDVEAS